MKVFSHVAIPATEFERAFAFYATLTGGLIQRNPQVPFPMAYFVDADGKDVGPLFQLPGFSPSKQGPIVYMELTANLDETLRRVAPAGGTVIMPKTHIAPGKGYWALFCDTEGNRLALHSAQ